MPWKVEGVVDENVEVGRPRNGQGEEDEPNGKGTGVEDKGRGV